MDRRLMRNSVEKDDVQVVAVNDPFIEPTYAVCIIKAIPGLHLTCPGLHAQV